LHLQQTPGDQPLRRKRWRKRHMRSPHQHHRLGAALRQCRQQQAPLAVHPGGLQNFDKCTDGPTTAGQLRIQHRVPRGQHLLWRLRHGVRMPDIGMNAVQSKNRGTRRGRHGKGFGLILFFKQYKHNP